MVSTVTDLNNDRFQSENCLCIYIFFKSSIALTALNLYGIMCVLVPIPVQRIHRQEYTLHSLPDTKDTIHSDTHT